MSANITNIDLTKLPTFDRNVEIATLEDRVVEAAVAWRESDKTEFGEPFWEHVDDLRKAVDALVEIKMNNANKAGTVGDPVKFSAQFEEWCELVHQGKQARSVESFLAYCRRTTS